MEELIGKDDMILLFDTYGEESKKLHDSFKLSGFNPLTVVIEDDGFLPDDVQSVTGFFLGDYTKADHVSGRPLYFNEVVVPDYWEISGNNQSGKIHNMEMERGRIFYAKPEHKRHVKVVDWLDEKGVVRFCDHYNRYGALYARTAMNAKGEKVTKTYYSPEGKEVLVINHVTGDIILNDEGKTLFFKDMEALTIHYFLRADLQQTRIFYNSLWHSFFVSQRLASSVKSDVLFWNEPKRPDIPGNMQVILDSNAARTNRILVQKRAAYEELIRLGADPSKLDLLGYVYPFEKQNGHGRDALICTNSDNIAHLKELVEGLPEIHFHVAALTEMSSKLMAYGSYENVSLYPNVRMKVLDELFVKSDWYFDVNHENEIVSAVSRAFLFNHLIVAFRETLHNEEYVAPNHVYSKKDVTEMLADVKAMLLAEELLEKHLKEQRHHACAEETDRFASVIEGLN